MGARPDEERIYYATLTSKGQVTLPKELRDELGLEAGSQIAFTRRDGTIAVSSPRRRSFREAIGTLTLPEGMTVDEYVSDMRHDPGDREILRSGPGVKKVTYIEDLSRESHEK